MKVKDLIKKLQAFDGEFEVTFSDTERGLQSIEDVKLYKGFKFGRSFINPRPNTVEIIAGDCDPD